MPISRDLSRTDPRGLRRSTTTASSSSTRGAGSARQAFGPRTGDARDAAEDAAFDAMPRPAVADRGSTRDRSSSAGAGARAARTGLASLVRTKLGRVAAAVALGVALVGGVVGVGVGSGPSPDAPKSALQLRVMQMHAQPAAVDTATTIGAFDVAPLAQLAGMTQDELARSVTHAGLAAVVPREQRIDVGGGTLVIPAGARIDASIDDDALRISSVPALTYERDRALDATISSVTYRFAENRLHVEAGGLGPDAIYSRIATKQANDALLPLLPPELTRGGVDPHDVGRLRLLHRTVASLVDGERGGARGVDDGVGAAVGTWEASVQLRPIKEVRGDLGDGLNLLIKRDVPLDLRVTATTQDGRPVVQTVELSAPWGDGPVVRKGDSRTKSLELQRLVLERNPAATTADSAFRVRADYSLAAEHEIRGAVALLGALFGAAQGRSPEVGAAIAVQRTGDVRLDGARRQIDDAFQRLSAPVAKLLSQLHVAAPGVGLDRIG